MLKERSVIRQSLLNSIMEVVNYNLNKKNKDIYLYEIANVYSEVESEYIEDTKLAFVMTGKYLSNTWNSLNYETDFYLIKGVVENLLEYLGLSNRYSLKLSDNLPKEIHPKINSEIIVDGTPIGYFGKLHPNVTKEDVYVCELSLTSLFTHKTSDIKYTELNKYPTIEKDVAFVVDKSIQALDLVKDIKTCGGKLLTNVKIFDVYTGDKIDEGKKSIAYNLTFEDKTRALTEEEVMEVFNKIIDNICHKYNATIRDK